MGECSLQTVHQDPTGSSLRSSSHNGGRPVEIRQDRTYWGHFGGGIMWGVGVRVWLEKEDYSVGAIYLVLICFAQ